MNYYSVYLNRLNLMLSANDLSANNVDKKHTGKANINP